MLKQIQSQETLLTYIQNGAIIPKALTLVPYNLLFAMRGGDMDGMGNLSRLWQT